MRALNKLPKLNQRGHAHYVLPLIVIVVVAFIGVKVIGASHAATPTFIQVMNYSDAEAAPTDPLAASQISTEPGTINNIIGSQTLSVVNPGGELKYSGINQNMIGGTDCYYVEILPHEGGLTTAQVKFLANGTSVTVSLSPVYANNATTPGSLQNLQRVCVAGVESSSSSSNGPAQLAFAYNVANVSPNVGPAVLVYEDIISNN